MYDLILPVTDIAFPDIEMVMNIIGSAATRLKARLDLIYEVRKDGDGKVFSGLQRNTPSTFFNVKIDFSTAAWITH